MSKKHSEMMARIGLAGAIIPTYLEQRPEPTPEVKKALNKLDFYTQKAIRIYGRVGKKNLEKIGEKIDKMRAETCLGRACSILTFIAYAVNLLERSMDREKPIAMIGGSLGLGTIRDMIFSLCGLHIAIDTRPHVGTCQKAGERAAEIWEGVGI